MQQRLNAFTAAPEIMQAFLTLSDAVTASGLDHRLAELVKIRASQINGCAFCLHMHTRDARKAGETEERLYMIDAWRETPLYSERERAALAWTEALTRVADTYAPDADYALIDAHFSDEEKVKLTMLIAVINGWNRINAGFRVAPALRRTARAA